MKVITGRSLLVARKRNIIKKYLMAMDAYIASTSQESGRNSRAARFSNAYVLVLGHALSLSRNLKRLSRVSKPHHSNRARSSSMQPALTRHHHCSRTYREMQPHPHPPSKGSTCTTSVAPIQNDRCSSLIAVPISPHVSCRIPLAAWQSCCLEHRPKLLGMQPKRSCRS